MPAKWQQWMPFKIEKFWSSPSVQAMSHAAQIGYLRLLGSQWQSPDGAISADTFDLAEQSGLGDENWAIHGPRILRKFISLDDGRLRNLPNYDDWCEAKRIFEARQAAAQKTTKERSPRKTGTVTEENRNGHRTVTDESPSRSADTITGTVTSTNTEIPKKQEPLRRDKPVADERAALFREDFERAFKFDNNAPAPWDAKEATNLSRWLKANPTITREQWQAILQNRHKSPVNKASPLSIWVGKALSWLNGIADEWGKPISGGLFNGKGTYEKPTTADRQIAELQLSVRDYAATPRADQDGNGAIGDGSGPSDPCTDAGGVGSDAW